MRLKGKFDFVTLVLVGMMIFLGIQPWNSALAAPKKDMQTTQKPDLESKGHVHNPHLDDSLIIDQSAMDRKGVPGRFSQESPLPKFTISGGIKSGKVVENKNSESPVLIGVRYWNWKQDLHLQTMEAHYLSTNRLQVGFFHNQPLGFFDWSRPHWKLGIEGVYLPDELLSSLINYKRYFLVGGFDFIDLLNIRYRLQTGAQVSYGAAGVNLGLNLSFKF